MSPEASIVAARLLGLCTDLGVDLEVIDPLRHPRVATLRVPPERDHRFHGNVITRSTPS